MNFELNLTYDATSETHEFLQMSIERLIRYGWGGCALTVNVTTMKNIPPPPDPISLSKQATAILERQYGLYVLADYTPFPQFTRLNLITGNVQEVHQLTHRLPTITYDIISVTPLSDAVFKTVCSTIDVDLISIDVSQYQPKSCWKELKSAVNRDITIELLYSHLLGSDFEQKNLISACDSISHATKGRKSKGRVVVLSCGKDDPEYIRSPSDVRNFGNLLQIPKFEKLTSEFAKVVIAKGLARKSNAGVVRKMKALPPEEDDMEITIMDAPA
ncbi:hypothetical protein TRFO_35031 [Tritrichomonas foetus]|uniref:Uncharacterized protein n=1 Tax=Tritrichomonas foetus TaxID=1144522 RepID=A0A1J4JIJ3_9EUKA|nr:hypothetical protein TRFO_35031 [Tritrichomonas foetus]|eukprot:OHS98505.1 hypothetical protein TRFO_35031 [Tritrichomonas foetus]